MALLFGINASSETAVDATDFVTVQDIFTLFHLDRSFKFVSKTSNFLIPIIGWSMFLTGKSWSTWFMAFNCNLLVLFVIASFLSLLTWSDIIFVAVLCGHWPTVM